MNKEPTEKEIKRFWEWCGLKWFWNHNPDCHCGAVDDDDSERSWHYKDGDEWKLATRFWYEEMRIDLNNLFKYAVPKLQDKGECISLIAYEHRGFKCLITYMFADEPHTEAYHETNPALALFWAINQIIEH